MKVTSITASNKFSTVTVSDAVFGAEINKDLLSQAIRVYLANKRQGTSKVKNRGEVARTKKKWFKQKGTGNARHGARSAPIFVGGGVAHGPTGLQNWALTLSKKMKRKALITALSAQAENVIVIDGLSEIEGKTKNAAQFLDTIKATDKKVLLVLDYDNDSARRAFNNIPTVITIESTLINALNVAHADVVVMTKKALKNIETRLMEAEVTSKSETTDK